MSIKEEYIKKSYEIQEKYKDVIVDLCMKYDKDLGVGFDMLKAIAYAKANDEEPLYAPTIEYDEEELLKDYEELEALHE